MPVWSARLAVVCPSLPEPGCWVPQCVDAGGVLLLLELLSSFEIKSVLVQLASHTVLLNSWKMVA